MVDWWLNSLITGLQSGGSWDLEKSGCADFLMGKFCCFSSACVQVILGCLYKFLYLLFAVLAYV